MAHASAFMLPIHRQFPARAAHDRTASLRESTRSAPAADGALGAPRPALTGANLAAFRRGAGLTQVAAAQRLGVTQGTISKAEGSPRAVLGPALQEALGRAAG